MTAMTNNEQHVDDPTQHDTAPTHRARRRRLGAASAVLALVLGSTACATDDDTTEPADSADAATTDATETTAATESTTPSPSDASASSTTAVDAVAADVLTDTLAGEGVDLFLNLVGIVGLDEITDADEVTLFVPSDEAFTSIEGDELAAIVDDPLIVRDVLESHLVEGAVLSSDLNDGDTVDPVSGESLDVTIDGETVMIGQATVTSADILFDGGVIHIIDDVLVLPDADVSDDDEGESAAADVLTDTLAGEGVDLFLNLVGIVGLDEITDADEVTLFVPSDEAFTSIEGDELAAIIDDPLVVREVLESHVVEGAVLSSDLSNGDTVDPVSGESLDVTIDGETVMIGQATVTSADILFDGGVIHIIDDVLVLPEA